MKSFLTLLQFLQDHNPFDSECVQLRNIFSRIVDSQYKVTADDVKFIGLQIQSKLS